MNLKLMMPLVCLVLTLGTSCTKEIDGHGPSRTETRTVSAFTDLVVDVPARVIVTQEQDYSLTIEGQQNVLNVIRTSVGAGELRIKFLEKTSIGRHNRVVIKVSAPLFKKLFITADSDLTCDDVLNTSNIKLEAKANANINLTGVEATGRIDAYINGSGNIQIHSGYAAAGEISINGSGDMEMTDLIFKKVTAIVNGSGDIRAGVSDELNARISGSGSIYYKGNAAVTSKISGSGEVKKL